MVRVIDDTKFRGMTIEQRLSSVSLLEEYRSALQREDLNQVLRLLKEVLLVPHYAEWIAPRLIQARNSFVPKPKLDLDEPRNALALAHLRSSPRATDFPPCMAVLESPRDPFLTMGSHPDIVERLWDGVGAELPECSRAIVFGIPSLVAPETGLLLAQSYGTQYVIRIPEQCKEQALKNGAKTTMTWAGGKTTDLGSEYGVDWVFGHWAKDEPQWCFRCSRA